MADVVDLAERRQPARRPDPGSSFSDELECVGTAGELRVSIARPPPLQHAPGWLHVVLSKGLGTATFSVFPIPDTPFGLELARVAARVALRSLRGAAANLDPAAIEEPTPEEEGLHEGVRRLEEARQASLQEEQPPPPSEPPGAA